MAFGICKICVNYHGAGVKELQCIHLNSCSRSNKGLKGYRYYITCSSFQHLPHHTGEHCAPISSSSSQKFYEHAVISEARSAHCLLCSTSSKAERLHPISSSNQQARCLSKITTAKLTRRYTCHSAPLLVSPFHERKEVLPEQQQHVATGLHARGAKPFRTSLLTGLPPHPHPPTGKHPPPQLLDCHSSLFHMHVFMGFLKRGI